MVLVVTEPKLRNNQKQFSNPETTQQQLNNNPEQINIPVYNKLPDF